MAVAAYHFMIRSSTPNSHVFGASGLTVAEGDCVAKIQGAWGETLERQQFFIHRDPATHPGTTMTLSMKFSEGQSRVGFNAVARQVTMTNDTVSDLQAYTWNNPPTWGNVLGGGVQRFSRLPQVINPEPDPNWTWTLTVPADAEDFGVRIEVVAPGNQTGTPVTATSQVYITDSDIEFS